MSNEVATTLAQGLEGRYYADDSVFNAERERIFRRSWHIVGHVSAMAEVGSIKPIEIAGCSVFVSRCENGELRAFRNVCRHRGARLVHDRPVTCKTIQCPYHGWRYGLDGQLLDTPWFGEPTPFDLASLSLMPAAVDIWRGLIFVALEPREPLLAQLGDMPSFFTQVPIERMVEIDGRSFVEPFNWKVYVDQFTEFYHSPAVHGSDERVGIQRFTADPIDRGMLMRAPDGLAFYGAQWAWNWPDWILGTFEGGIKITRIMPLSAGECEVRFLFLIDPEVRIKSSNRQRVIDATFRIFGEDAAVLRRVQCNLASGMFESPGPLHPRLERATAYFQGLVREALA